MRTTNLPPTRIRRRAGALAAVALVALIGTSCTDDTEWEAQRAAMPRVEVSTVPDGTAAQLEAALVTTMERYGVPGAAVAVTDPTLGDWVATAGVADLESGEPVTTAMEWPIRSTTKSFTVTLLLQLVDEGEVSLDDTIDQWVDGVPNGDEVTLQQLADMSAGVPEYITADFVDDFVADTSAPYSNQELIAYALTEEPVAEPGQEHIYINTSTLLLGEVVEQVSGQPFEAALAERILDPLELESTRYPTEPEGWEGAHATGYQPDDDGLAPAPQNFTVFGPAGAMVSTLDDLLVWGPALAEGALLDADTQAQRLDGVKLDEGPEYDRYAAGIGELEGWWGHTGEGFGFTALVMHQIDSGATVAITMNLSNAGDHPPTKLFREIAAILDDA